MVQRQLGTFGVNQGAKQATPHFGEKSGFQARTGYDGTLLVRWVQLPASSELSDFSPWDRGISAFVEE